MVPTSSEDAKAEQLRLAKELQRDFQKSGTFKANSLGQSRSRSKSSKATKKPAYDNQPSYNNQPARHLPHPPQASRHQIHNSSVIQQPRTPNIGKSATSSNQASVFDNRKRKMDSQAADFFADRPNTAQERGPIQYYQGQDRASAPAVTPAFAASSMATNTAQPTSAYKVPAMATNRTQAASTNAAPQFSSIDASFREQNYPAPSQLLQQNMAQTASMGQANAVPAALPAQIQIPSGPVVWLYQDNNEQPQPLARDENMMDMDMPDVGTAGALSERHGNQMTICSCTRLTPPAGPRGLGASRWAADNMKIDDNCPYHGIQATSSFRRNNNGNPGNDYDTATNYNTGATQAASENRPNRFVGYYQ